MEGIGELSTSTCSTKFSWKIPGFRKKLFDSSDDLLSPEFCLCDTRWCVNLIVEDYEEGQQQLEIYLHPCRTNTNDVLVNCTFALRDPSSDSLGELACQGFTHWFPKDSTQGWGCDKFVDVKTITSTDITVDVSISTTVRPEDLPYYTSEDTVKNNLRFLRSAVGPDVTFTVEDRQFTAHREILSSQSEVFQRMFDTEMTEARTGNITVLDAKAEVFEKFLDFLYTGAYPQNFDVLAEDLFALAHKYDIKSLEKLCIGYFETMDLDHEGAGALLLLSGKYPSVGTLKVRIIDYIENNPQFLESAEWEQVKRKDPLTCIDILTLCVTRNASKRRRYSDSD